MTETHWNAQSRFSFGRTRITWAVNISDGTLLAPTSARLQVGEAQSRNYVRQTLVPEVQVLPSSHRIAFKGNFFILAIYVRSRSNELHAYAGVDPATVQLKPGFTRNTEGWPLSHNRLEIIIRNRDDLEQAKPYIEQVVKNDLRGEPFDWASMERAGRL
ncbi:MAG: hypothetical protein J4G17_04290 [Anaerolineae bacterium]|nr:hypothetical protein [Anaerolineae bacterium]